MRPRVPREVREEVCCYAASGREQGTPWAVLARKTCLDVRKLQRWQSRARRAYAVSAQRGVEVGWKNHYGSRSERGARVAALLYSLIESVRLFGVELRAYLREAALRADRSLGTATPARDIKSSQS